VWNLASDKHTDPDVSIPATGAIEHLEVSGSSILFSVDEPVSQDTPDNTVGMVYLLNTADMSSLAIKVRNSSYRAFLGPNAVKDCSLY
jgi:hypothetical protein